MIVRTVSGDIDPADLGVTFAHEHLIIDSPVVEREWPHIYLPSADEATLEMEQVVNAGVGAVVDAMPTGSGRDVTRLREVADRSGVHVIAATGMHTVKYYEDVPWATEPSEALADRFTREIVDDADGSGGRAGIIKVATLADGFSSQEAALFEAAATSHARTRAPIITHCEGGRGGMAQVERLRGLGVPLERVILSHTDKVEDEGYHRDLLGSGVNLVYDQALRHHGQEPNPTAVLLGGMWDAGHGLQLLLGTDGARRSLWTTLGGAPGIAWLKTGFVEQLRRLGLVTEQIATMFVGNPRRVLSFDPPA